MRFIFGNYILDTSRRGLRQGAAAIDVEPQVFDLLTCLVSHRDHVVSKDSSAQSGPPCLHRAIPSRPL